MHLSSGNVVSTFLLNLSSLYRYLLTFFVLILICFSWFIFFYSKFKDDEINLINEIKALNHKEKLLIDLKNEINHYFIDIKNLEQQKKNIIETYEDDINIFDLLIKNVKELNLIITSFNFDNCLLKGDYTKSIITFNFKGEIDQVIEFFKILAKSKHWFKFKKINISSDSDNQLNIEIVFKFYIPKKVFKWETKES